VHEFVDPEAGPGSLPRLREEGWRKAVQGQACADDVATLPGAQRPMRTLREIMAHAGVVPSGAETAAGSAPAVAAATRPAAPAAARGPRPAPAVAEAQMLSHILKDACSQRAADPKRLTILAGMIATRGLSDAPLSAVLAPATGFRLATHSVNVALIAARIWAALGLEPDPRVCLLALVHDAGLVKAGVDPDAELPATGSEETLDPKGDREDPGPILKALGPEAVSLAESIRAVHGLLRFDLPTPQERARADTSAQVVALSSLLDLHSHGSGDRPPADLHDVTSLVMEQHGRRFPPALFRALLRAIPIFPIGALVELSSGDLARVVSLNEDNHFRPRVEIIASASGQEPGERRVIDLARAPFLHIRHRVTAAAPSVREAV
jgi:hypothetical protein